MSMPAIQNQDEAGDGMKAISYSAGQRASNRWVTGAFLLYLLLVLFCSIIGVCTDSAYGYLPRKVAFSLANASWRAMLGAICLGLIALTPALALTLAYIRSAQAATRKRCVAIALLLPIMAGCLTGGALFYVYLAIPALPFNLYSLLRAISTHAIQNGEWWNETTGICLFSGVAAWTLSWLAAPLIERHKDSPPGASLSPAPHSIAR